MVIESHENTFQIKLKIHILRKPNTEKKSFFFLSGSHLMSYRTMIIFFSPKYLQNIIFSNSFEPRFELLIPIFQRTLWRLRKK